MRGDREGAWVRHAPRPHPCMTLLRPRIGVRLRRLVAAAWRAASTSAAAVFAAMGARCPQLNYQLKRRRLRRVGCAAAGTRTVAPYARRGGGSCSPHDVFSVRRRSRRRHAGAHGGACRRRRRARLCDSDGRRGCGVGEAARGVAVACRRAWPAFCVGSRREAFCPYWILSGRW